MIRGWLLLLAPSGLGPACGAEADVVPLELLDFRQNELDSVGLNEELSFYFSEEIERSSVTSESVRILGPRGRVVTGKRVVRGNALSFLPDLPCASDLGDGALRPGERYRVILGGFPRPDGLRSESGAGLSASLLLGFKTAEVGGTSPLFLDPFTGPFPLFPRGKLSNPVELEDGILVLECAEALDPSSVPGARFELAHFPAGASEPVVIPLAARLIVNLRDHAELLLEPSGEAPAERRLAPDKYILQMIGRDLQTLGGRALEPGWGPMLKLVVPSAHVEVRFDEPRDRSSDQPPGCSGTALWGGLEEERVDARGLHLRFPAAAGSGIDGGLELVQPPTRNDVHATRLTVPAGTSVDLSGLVGPVVLRSQTLLEVRGRLVRSGAGAPSDPLRIELENASERRVEHWQPLSAWIERLLDPDPSRPWANQPWTVLIAGGDIRVPDGGSIEVEGPLVLVAGGWIRVGGAVLAQGDLWRTPEGGGVLASHARLKRLPLVLDPPVLNPLRVPLAVGLLTRPFPWTPRGSGWTVLLAGNEGGGRLSVAFLPGASGLPEGGLVLDPAQLGSGPVRALLGLEVPPGAGEPWDPPHLERLRLDAILQRAPSRAHR